MPKRPRDTNQLAAQIVALSTGQAKESPAKADKATGKAGNQIKNKKGQRH